MAGETILVVEDDVSVRELLETALRSRGYVVHACADGLVGLTTLEQVRPHLMIVDIMMPRLDGMTFVRAIKSKAEMKRIPVIFLTAKSDARSMIDGINLGAKYYVTKPFEVEGLLSKIAKALV